MKILHTSDWHVGKTLRGASRHDEFAAVLGEIADVADTEDVDMVIIAGDVYDTGNPGPDAERLVNETLERLAKDRPVVVIAGNHDNPRRWGAIRSLLDLANVTVAGAVARPDKGGVVRVDTKSGPANVALVPWLSQRNIVKADDLMDYDRDANANAFSDRMRRVLAGLASAFVEGEVNVMTAHMTVVDSTGQVTLGGGERRAHTIFDYCVDTGVFPSSAQYVALGHIHQAQTLSAKTQVRYSGCPMHLDFSDTPADKTISIVEVEPGEAAVVREVPIAAGRKLITLKGTLDQCVAQASRWGDAWFRVKIDEAWRTGLDTEVRDAIPGAVDVRIASLGEDVDAEPDDEWAPVEEADPVDLFGEFLAERDISDPKVIALFKELLEERLNAGDDDTYAEIHDLPKAS